MLAPPLLVSFASSEDYIEALSQDLRDQFEAEIRELVGRGLPPVVSSRCLALLFGYSTKFVNALAQDNHKYYREFTIRKGRKTRKIKAPKVALKVIQKWFGAYLAEAVSFGDHVFGFVPGRSAIEAAAQHCGSDWVYSVDIKDFFPTTRRDSVEQSLVSLGYSDKASHLIAGICCYKDCLAQGAPSSPVLSNLVMAPIDEELKELSNRFCCKYTRYADDIVFSGSEGFPENIVRETKAIFDGTQWQLSADKEYIADSSKGQRLKVHGLLVNGDRPKLTKGYRNKIRAYEHMLRNNKVRIEDRSRLEGHVMFSDSVKNFR